MNANPTELMQNPHPIAKDRIQKLAKDLDYIKASVAEIINNYQHQRYHIYGNAVIGLTALLNKFQPALEKETIPSSEKYQFFFSLASLGLFICTDMLYRQAIKNTRSLLNPLSDEIIIDALQDVEQFVELESDVREILAFIKRREQQGDEIEDFFCPIQHTFTAVLFNHFKRPAGAIASMVGSACWETYKAVQHIRLQNKRD